MFLLDAVGFEELTQSPQTANALEALELVGRKNRISLKWF